MKQRSAARRRTAFLAVIVLVVSLAYMIAPAFVSAAEAADRTWTDVAADTEELLLQAADAYAAGDVGAAKEYVDRAYFGPFESEGLEATIKSHISGTRAFELEQRFKELKMGIAEGAGPGEVDRRAGDLAGQIRADAVTLDGGAAEQGSYSILLQSLLIILREGVEAILILSAVIAYLIKANGGVGLRSVYGGAAGALVASAGTAVILREVLGDTAGFTQEVLEGATMLLAVAVLFWVSYWLAAKAQARRWEAYVAGKVQSAAGTPQSGGRTFALAGVAFLAVYREGAETILFYAALSSGNPAATGEIALGFGIGLVLLAVIFAVLRWGSVRLPIGPFFAVTSALLYYPAFVFAGRGIRELQEAGLVSSTSLGELPVIDFLGFYPTVETVVLQAVLVGAAVAAGVWKLRSLRGQMPTGGPRTPAGGQAGPTEDVPRTTPTNSTESKEA